MSDFIATLLLGVLVRSAGMLCVVIVLAVVWRRRRAMVASSLINATLVGLLALPVLMLASPQLSIAVLRPDVTAGAGQAPEGFAPDDTGESPVEAAAREPDLRAGLGAAIAAPPVMPTDVVYQAGDTTPTGAGGAASSAHRSSASRPVAALSLALLAVYAAGAALLVVRLIHGLLLLRRLRAKATPLSGAWLKRLEFWRTNLGVKPQVLLCASNEIGIPLTSGWRRPFVLIPSALLESPAPERDAMLLHELTHVRRGDALWLLLLRVVECVYWCQPLVWVLSRIDRQLRERACDEVCHARLGGGSRYRDALLAIARGIAAKPRLAVGLAMVGRSALGRRLAHIDQSAGSALTHPARGIRVSLACTVAIAVLIAGATQFVPRETAADRM